MDIVVSIGSAWRNSLDRGSDWRCPSAKSSQREVFISASPPIPPPFEVRIRPDRSRVLVAPVGELDLATADDLQSELDELHTNGWRSVVIDLRDLIFLDSTGLRLILEERRRCQAEGMAFAIVDGPAAVRRVLEVSGVSELLPRADPAG